MASKIDFEIRDGVLMKYHGNDDDVTIPYGVNEIGELAFAETNVSCVEIPESVKAIGESAFEECVFLKTVIIPQSVTEIGFRAFAECDELEAITIPDSVTHLKPGTFFGCTNLCNVALPDGLISIGGGAFQHCSALESMYVPESVTSIGSGVFAFCDNLTSINIPRGVTVIESSAFEECKKLYTISLSGEIHTIEKYAFANSGLKSIVFDGTKAQWDNVSKGKDWNKGAALKVKCTDESAKEFNSAKPFTLKDFKNRGMRVKVVSVKNWSAINDISDREAYLIWLANDELAKRRIIYMLLSVLILTSAVLSWVFLYKFNTSVFMLAPILTVISIVMIIMAMFWRKQLSGFKFFCELRRLPKFDGVWTFLYVICRVIGFIYMALGLLVLFIMIFITSSSGGEFSIMNDRLGIPEHIGQDDLIEQGEACDEEFAASVSDTILNMFNELDYIIDNNAIETDYALKKSKIDDAEQQIADMEKDEEELSLEDKQKLKELKEKAKSAREKLEENYKQAKTELADNYGKPE